ncbi:hypothetical protein PAXINDRAFT_16741 [Paxillus involutus ATCC 200175]|uniref:DUF6830 domain-containing protein n=1 Tax=Paxillus involutus ATCC 200175 TaxID=664439 RepID=A0A0C9SR89_PAXIN|nr:hypothetical protein PAXINDRAFT_16741 [Paxillus involutus ATCC 200175]
MQWTADITEHAHVEEIKIPACSGNNQNYYSQISRHLDCLEKCFRFDLATYIESHPDVTDLGVDDEAFKQDNEHDPDPNDLSLFEYYNPTCVVVNYFAISEALFQGKHPKALKPHRIFSTTTTAFRVANKPSLRLTIDKAMAQFALPDLCTTICEYWKRIDDGSVQPLSGARTEAQNFSLPFDRLQIDMVPRRPFEQAPQQPPTLTVSTTQ